MKKRQIQIGVMIALGSLMASGGVAAAPGEAKPEAKASKTAKASRTSPAEKSPAENEESADALPAEELDLQAMARAAKEKFEKVEASASGIEGQKKKAKDEKDPIKTLCLGDKSSQMAVTIDSASDRVAGIEAAAKSGNRQRAVHDNMVLDALVDRAGSLGVEANQCIGVEQGSLGGEELKVSIDPDIPQGNLTSLQQQAAPPANLPSVTATPPRGEPPGVLGRILEIPTPTSPTL